MNFKHILLGTAAAVSIAALAQNNAAMAAHRGWYVGIEGGANWISNDSFKLTGNVGALETGEGSTTQLGKANFDTGWAVLATIGYAFDNNWRIEAEGGYRHNKLNAVVIDPGDFGEGAGESIANYHGNLNEFSLMANVLYDFHLTDKLSFSIGAGAGVDNSQLTIGPLKDTEWNFAYQGIAGLNYAVTQRLDLFVDFRYLVVPNPDYTASFGPIGIHAQDYDKETVTVGLRWDLTADEEPMAAAPPPPPPPPAEPAAPRQFIVFFGFNKSNLTAEAHRVVQEAAASAKQYGSATILITGHTDTVGSNGYNMRLSIRRAKATKSGLVAEGVTAGSITTVGKGETELLVQTADGVKEPQNRRATIDLNVHS